VLSLALGFDLGERSFAALIDLLLSGRALCGGV
jgi:hypothetical protein